MLALRTRLYYRRVNLLTQRRPTGILPSEVFVHRRHVGAHSSLGGIFQVFGHEIKGGAEVFIVVLGGQPGRLGDERLA